ncbi:hypothetical protein L873DRAFT_1794984 [Choiromyces venosus 120613-1]|uniref:NAD(P)-binding protein n=1 Tax=Choiromyces venosus 120613-1 TaxID=1336337 RepID=A0A3N4JBR0_9PEZI|nr:hypothetical protein L873DRAFT_1794984 [Choiromyces venosus 120613-1]
MPIPTTPPNEKQQRIWLAIGTSTGFGYELALDILRHGDKVIAAGRDPSRLEPLKKVGAETIKINQNEPLQTIQKDFGRAIAMYRCIDICVFNAAHVTVGTLEERTSRRAGTICTVGSMESAVNAFGLSFTLQNEVAPFNIKAILDASFTIVLPDTKIEDYREMNAQTTEFIAQKAGRQVGDTKKGVQVMHDVIASTGMAEGREMPEYLPLGSDAVKVDGEINNELNELIDEWAEMGGCTDYPPEQRYYSNESAIAAQVKGEVKIEVGNGKGVVRETVTKVLEID